MTDDVQVSRRARLVMWLLSTTVAFGCHWFEIEDRRRLWVLLYDVAVGGIMAGLFPCVRSPRVVLPSLGGLLMACAPLFWGAIRGGFGVKWDGTRVRWTDKLDEMLVWGFSYALSSALLITILLRRGSEKTNGESLWLPAGLIGTWVLWGSYLLHGKWVDFERIILGVACMAVSLWLAIAITKQDREHAPGGHRLRYRKPAVVIGLSALAWFMMGVPPIVAILGGH